MKSFAYLEREEVDGEVEVYLVPLVEDDMLDGELSNVGFPEGWYEEVQKYPSGYYEIEFDYHMESEGWESPHEYPVIDELLSLKKTVAAFRKGMKKFYVDPATHQVSCLFRKCWRIEYLYGGAGICSPDMYLPIAIWYRIFNVKKFAYWGEGFKPTLTKR